MAVFNPDFKETGIPTASGGRAAEQPDANKSLGILFKGLGDVLEAGFKGADEVYKSVISDKIYDASNKERNDFTSELGAFNKDLAPGKKTADAGNGMDAYAQASEEDLPGDVADVESNVATLAAAKAAGKVSTSEYWMRLNNMTKELRSQYPGYRDYIDQKVSQVTGHNPANAYMTSLIQDLNRQATAGKVDPVQRDTRALLKAAIAQGVPGATAMSTRFEAGEANSVEARLFVEKAGEPKYKADLATHTLVAEKGNLELDAVKMDQIIRQQVNQQSLVNLESSHTVSGISTNQLIQSGKDMASGKTKYDPESILVWGKKLETNLKEEALSIRNDLNKPLDVDPLKRSKAQIAVGPGGDTEAYIGKVIEAAQAGPKNFSKLLVDKDVPLATWQLSMMEAQKTNDKYNALQTSSGKAIRIAEVLKDYPEAIRSFIQSPFFNKDYGSPNLNGFTNEMFTKMMTGGDPDTKRIVTPNEVIERAKGAKVDSPEFYKDVAEFPKRMLVEKDPRVKYNLMASMFNPDNINFIKNFQEDRADRPGRMKVYSDYTSKAMANEVAKVGAEHPEVLTWYKNWTEHSAVTLFGQEMRDLKNTATTAGVTFKYNTGDGKQAPFISINVDAAQADAQTEQLRRMGIRGTGVQTPLMKLNGQVDRLNTLSNSLFNAAPVLKVNANDWFLTQFKAAGADTDFTQKDSRTTADQMAKAVNAAMGAVYNTLKNNSIVQPHHPNAQ